MIAIRQARREDWPAIRALILADSSLQHNRLPHWRDFVVAVSSRQLKGCCALKVYGRKLAEIRSFAFKDEESRRLFSHILVRLCLQKASSLKTYQVLATIAKEEQGFFRSEGFKRQNGQKHAMLLSLAGHQPLAIKDLAGIKFVRARTKAHWQGIVRLVKRYRKTLIQPESKLFPPKKDFLVAIADGKVVGCTALALFRRKRGRPCDMAEVRTVVVDPDYKGRGIGPQLVLRCVNWALEFGLVELFTVTGQRNWFERLNFSTRRGSEEAWFMYP